MATARVMANIVLMWDDAITEVAATTIHSSSTPVAGFAAANLLDSNRQTCFKTSETGDDVFVTWTFGAAHTIKAFSIHNHNAGTKGVSNLLIKYSATDAAASSTKNTFDVSTYIGDDDFFQYFSASQAMWRMKVEFDSVDSSGLYLGRLCAWRQVYQLERGIMPGSLKGYRHLEDILTTKGGIKHRISRGGTERSFTGLVNYASAAELAKLEALMEHIKVNHKPFCVSWPGGTTTYTGSNIYGAAVHAVIDAERWDYGLQIAGRGNPILPIVEQL